MPAVHQDNAPAEEVERKLSAARAQLIVEKPFLGVLVLHLPLIAADPRWCKTTATDARGIYYNRDYIRALSLEQTKFVLAHEALHCALSHLHRRDHRAKHRWDIACDLAVNAILVADGLSRPPNALWQKAYDGMSAEEIYPYIKDDTTETTLDEHIDDADPGSCPYQSSRGRVGSGSDRGPTDGKTSTPPMQAPAGGENDDTGKAVTQKTNDKHEGAPRPAPLRGAEGEQLAMQWRLRLAAAAQQALRAGKLSADLARIIDDLLQPQLPWRMLLARYMTAVARTDYSFARPRRRESSAILPGLRAAHINVVVAIDTSGSIKPAEMQEFVSEVNAIKGQLNARITLHACDAALAPDGPWVYEPWEEMRLPRQFVGGGGTRFTPVFAWVEQLERPPDLLVYFTDAEGEFPAREPAFPVLWLVKGSTAVPWGQRVQLN